MYAVRGIAPSTRSGQNSHRSRVPPIRMHTPMTASANPMDPTASPTPDEWGPSRSRDRNHSPTSDRAPSSLEEAVAAPRAPGSRPGR